MEFLSAQSVTALMPLVRALANGELHSGEELGALLGVSRTAVWKQLKKLESIGLTVQSVKGAGYRLEKRLDLLDATALAQSIGGDCRVSVEPCIDSTSAFVAEQLKGGIAGPILCAAEMQTAGRGRRGRQWVSPFAGNLYFTVGYAAQDGVASYEGLSLAVGVEIVAAIKRLMGSVPLGLKWPNDILVGGKKLAGILIEVDGDLSGACNIVVGVGLNHSMLDGDAEKIDQPWLDLRQVAAQAEVPLPSRTQVLAAVSGAVKRLLIGYPDQGFAQYQERWQALDCHFGLPVAVITGGQETLGISRGVDSQGAFMLDVDGKERRFNGGEVSLRVRREA